MPKINVCLSCDNNYAKHAGVVIASILFNADKNDDLAIYILDGGISDESKQKIIELKKIKDCSIEFIKIDENLFDEYKKIKTHNYITLPGYYRLKLPSLLPNVEKIIYFDCDFVVCTSLYELFNKEIGSNIIAGVNDINRKRVKKNPTYINSGMILFDLKRMREENTESEFLKYTKENSNRIKMGDQEIINEVLKGKIQIIEDEWNVQSSNFLTRSSYTNHPKAIHILAKPWVYASASIHKKEYFKYLQLTPWAISEEEYKHWTIDNERDSIFAYLKRKPFVLFRPRFYEAVFKTYLKK